MLLYIDKKKQKQQKIKMIGIFIFIILFLISNYIYFFQKLYKSDLHLTNFATKDLTALHRNPKNSIIYFAQSRQKTPRLIILPKNYSRYEIIYLTELLQSNKSQIKYLKLDFKDDFLSTLIKQIIPDIKYKKSEKYTIITDNYKSYKTTIFENKLYPYTFKKETKNISLNITNTINSKFPLPLEPTKILDKELKNIKEFTNMYKYKLGYLLQGEYSNIHLNLSSEYYFLQHINLCFTAPKTEYCLIDSSSSLEKKLEKIRKQNFNPTNGKLHFLTSLKEIKNNDQLEKDEGLLIKFGKREAILLPNTFDIKNSFKLVKQKVGLNPLYYNDKMKFFKFKTVEIDLYDKI